MPSPTPQAHSWAAPGVEIPLYKPGRKPESWLEIIQPHQCAVFLSDAARRVSVSRTLQSQSADQATCILFDSIGAAEAFCQAFVEAHPAISCEVLDYEGRVNPPLLTIAAGHKGGDDARGWIVRHRHWLAAGLIGLAVPMFVYDWVDRGPLVLTVVGGHLVVGGLRLLMWDAGAKRAEWARVARLEAHRARELEARAKA